ncbi:glutamine ABC transporter substrate-binding protein [Bacteroidia bacterium]|nr:glutamine ABC transporter substrate-binding protein [Bacteroidia bacterium]
MTVKRKIIFLGTGIFGLALLMYGIVKSFSEKAIPVRDYAVIEASGVLNVVTEYNSVGYYVSGDSIAGIQYELCRYIEKRSGLQVHITLENSLETGIQKLKDNTCDVIALNIPITIESKKELAFTIPITQNKQVLVQRKPAEGEAVPLIRNQMDLANKTILVPKDSPGILRLQNLSEEIAEPIYIQEVEDYTQEQILYMVAYGQNKYAVVDKEIALKNAPLFPEIDIQTDISFTQLQAWAVRKNAPVLLDSLNVWIADYKK